MTAAAPLPVQYAAVPYRFGETGLEVLLATSRGTGRWVIPKGWPMKGRKPREAAAVEAAEEAGVRGAVQKKPLGRFVYWKRMPEGFVLCDVVVFGLEVKSELDNFREKGQRILEWVPAEVAADKVDEPGLSTLLRRLPDRVRPRKKAAA